MGIYKGILLVSSGWCNKILQIGWPNQLWNLFLTVLELGKDKIKVPATLVPIEDSLPHLEKVASLCPHLAGRGLKQALWYLFHKVTSPILRPPPQIFIKPNYLPKIPPPNTITLMVRLQHMKGRGGGGHNAVHSGRSGDKYIMT